VRSPLCEIAKPVVMYDTGFFFFGKTKTTSPFIEVVTA
jgi:hypothetical protein